MLYEALTAGCHVGVMALPALDGSSKLVEGIRRLRQEGLVTSSEATLRLHARSDDISPLAEHTRCAAIVLQRFFASRVD